MLIVKASKSSLAAYSNKKLFLVLIHTIISLSSKKKPRVQHLMFRTKCTQRLAAEQSENQDLGTHKLASPWSWRADKTRPCTSSVLQLSQTILNI